MLRARRGKKQEGVFSPSDYKESGEPVELSQRRAEIRI